MSKPASNLSRRDLLKFGGLSAVGALGMSALPTACRRSC